MSRHHSGDGSHPARTARALDSKREAPRQPFSPNSISKGPRIRGAVAVTERLPVLRRRLRPARLREGRKDHRHRGQLRRARSTAARSARRAPTPFSSPSTRTASRRSCTARRTRTTGRSGRSTGRWSASPSWSRRRATRTSRRRDEQGAPVNHVTPIGTLGGATLDNEENYLIKKLFGGGLGMVVDREPGPHMTQRLGARSGRHLRPRRGHDLPAGSGEQRLHRDHGLEHGRGPPGRLPLADEGAGARRDADPRRPALHAHLGDVRSFTSPMRAGSDIAFLGGLINYVLDERALVPGVRPRLHERGHARQRRVPRHRDLDGLFCGFDRRRGVRTRRDGLELRRASRATLQNAYAAADQERSRSASGAVLFNNVPPPSDPTLEDPRCVLNIVAAPLRALHAGDGRARSAAAREEQFLQVAETICENSGRERTSAFVYAVGWTQHTTGTQIIRAAGILQLLLGNMGRPGGGIMAMRGHASIQGSTDIPTLYNLLPGYMPQPAAMRNHGTLADYLAQEEVPTGFWANLPKFTVSLLEGLVRRRGDDGERLWLRLAAADRRRLLAAADVHRRWPRASRGLFCFGQNPAVGAPNAALNARAAAARLAGGARLVRDRDGRFWYKRPGRCPIRQARSRPKSSSCPPRSAAEKDGCFTNTQRLVQWHDKAVEPPGDCRSDAWFVYHLGLRLKQLYAGSTRAARSGTLRPDLGLRRDEPEPLRTAAQPRRRRAGRRRILARSTATRRRRQAAVTDFTELQRRRLDGVRLLDLQRRHARAQDRNRARDRRRDEQSTLHPDWGFAWPAQPAHALQPRVGRS